MNEHGPVAQDAGMSVLGTLLTHVHPNRVTHSGMSAGLTP
jgi:hypothetical protein